jgi:hypothetical protein
VFRGHPEVVPGFDQVWVGRVPGDRERVRIIEPAQLGLILPLLVDCNGELVGDLGHGQLAGNLGTVGAAADSQNRQCDIRSE